MGDIETIESRWLGGFSWPGSSLSGKEDRPVFHPLRERMEGYTSQEGSPEIFLIDFFYSDL